MKVNPRKVKKPIPKPDVEHISVLNGAVSRMGGQICLLSLVLILLTGQLIAQIPNRGFDTSVLAKDSTKAYKESLEILPQFPAESDFYYLHYSVPEKKINRYYDPKAVLPKNPLFLDTRSGSYYVPRMVTNRIAQIMNRPSPDAFVPVFAVAALAAKLALEHIQIEQKIKINPQDYDLPAKLHPILRSLWAKSPQTAFQLYQQKQINNKRTLTQLQKQLDGLIEKKLIKVKSQQEAPNLYYAAQSIEQARASIRVYLSKLDPADSQEINLLAMLKILDSF